MQWHINKGLRKPKTNDKCTHGCEKILFLILEDNSVYKVIYTGMQKGWRRRVSTFVRPSKFEDVSNLCAGTVLWDE
eukprot:UN04314